MTPREKAEELVGKFVSITLWNGYVTSAKECALICVDEILKALQVPLIENKGSKLYDSQIDYWQEVKKELEEMK